MIFIQLTITDSPQAFAHNIASLRLTYIYTTMYRLRMYITYIYIYIYIWRSKLYTYFITSASPVKRYIPLQTITFLTIAPNEIVFIYTNNYFYWQG